MDKDKVIRYLIAVGYEEEQIKTILGSPALRSQIEKYIIELEFKVINSRNKNEIDANSMRIYETMLQLKENKEAYIPIRAI